MVTNKVLVENKKTKEHRILIVVSDFDADMLGQINNDKYSVVSYERVEPLLGIVKCFEIK